MTMKRTNLDSKLRLPLNLQLFAEGEGDSEVPGDFSESNTTEEAQEAITFKTQAELDSFFDKRMDKALSTARSNWEKETEQKLKEAEEKGQMTEKERAQYDLEQEKQQLENDRHALKVERDEASIIKRLSVDKLPDTLATALMPLFGGDDKELDKAYSNVSKAFRESIEEAVNIRLAKTAGAPGSGEGGGKISDGATFAKNLNDTQKTETDLWSIK